MERWLKRLGRRRLTDADRLRHDAFLEEISAHSEQEPARRRWRSNIVHAWARLFDGGPTLAQVAFAAMLVGVAVTLITVAPIPHNRDYRTTRPIWASGALIFGILALAFELARSPRRLYPGRFLTAAAIPFAVGTFVGAITLTFVIVPDWTLAAALVLAGSGMVLTALAGISRSPGLLHRAIGLTALGAFGVVLSDGPWSVIYFIDRDTLDALGCALSATGSALSGVGLLRSRLELLRSSTSPVARP